MTNNRNYYTTLSNYVDHTRFGGLISPSDFDRKTSMTDVIGRIISDVKFDEQCRRALSSSGRMKKEKC